MLFLISFNGFCQAPSWTVNENNFQYTMTFVGSLNIDGIRLANLNDKVAAFVNGECRGVTNLIYVASEDKYYAYLTVFSNANNETVSFKMYDSVNNVVKEVFSKSNFASNANFGNLSLPYVFSNNALQQGAALLDVNFVGVTRNDITIVGNKVTVYLNAGQNVSALNTIFTSSPGSSVYIGNAQKISGANLSDYTNPITFRVVSEDQSTIREWNVAVQMPVYPVTLPTVFTLSKLTIDENQPVGTAVGDFNVMIEDRLVSELSLISGDGGFDNAFFEIIGNQLRVKSIFDFETKSLYKIRVRAISNRKEILEKTFEVTVLDDKLPTVFTLSKATIDENQVAGSIVGDFTVIKENRSLFTLTLVDGLGDEDNASYEIAGNSLKTREMFDFETKNRYKIRVKAENSIGEVLFATYVISVNDINDSPVLITISNASINENVPAGTVVGSLSTKDQDKDTSLYSFAITGSDYLNFDIIGNQLVLKKSLDFETQNIFYLDIISDDQRGGNVTEKLTVFVLDVNENPVISKNAVSNTVDFVFSDFSNNVSMVGKVEATDVDANTILTFEMVPGQQVPFTISADGTVSFDGTVGSNNKTSYSFAVKVTDNGMPALSDTVIVNIAIEFNLVDKLMFNNLVSPNGDGHNDRLLINNLQVFNSYVLTIYSPKGQVVYTTTLYKNDWVGNGLAEGEYYLYFIGIDQNSKQHVYKELVRLVYN